MLLRTLATGTLGVSDTAIRPVPRTATRIVPEGHCHSGVLSLKGNATDSDSVSITDITGSRTIAG